MAAATELTDIQSVRQFLQKSVSDKLQDADIETLIGHVSQAIERHCNRQFSPETAATKSFEWLPTESGVELVDFKPYEYRTISSIIVDSDTTKPTTLASTQWRKWPYPSQDGTFYGVRFTELPETELAFQTRRVDVTGDWGLTVVPQEVQHWANVTVEAWLHLRREGATQNQFEFGEGQLPRPEDLPVPVRWGLKRWVRPTPSV